MVGSIAALVTCGTCFGLVLQAGAQIWIMTPTTLQQDYLPTRGEIKGATSTFGAPFYGDRVLGQLVYAESAGQSYCTEADYQVADTDPSFQHDTYGEVRLIKIIIVRRGGPCSIVDKVKVAYQKGAHAVVVIDKEDSELTSQDMTNVIVKDNGSGDQIHIPSILIAKEDGKKLLDTLKITKVIVELKWTVPMDHIVKVDLWMSSASKECMQLLQDFAPARMKLNRVLQFTPHYPVFSVDTQDFKTLQNLCFDNSGKYCTEDIDGPGPLTGKDVLLENLRQKCIHRHYKKKHALDTPFIVDGKVSVERILPPIPEFAREYWNYVEKFLHRCPQKTFGHECSKKLMEEVSIDAAAIDNCVVRNATEMLDEEIANKAWSPRAVRINGWRYSGVLSADLITRAICSAFIELPYECKSLLNPRDVFKAYNLSGKQSVTFRTLLGWLLGTFAVGFALLLLYRRYLQQDLRATLREEVMLEVQAAMGQYSQMK